MNRGVMLDRIRDRRGPWDVCIIGGGATGLGVALDSASRGYSTVLVERGDFGQGTSSRSTKLIHGGVRYLQQGRVSFVREALLERDILRTNAPHLVRRLPFLIPNYRWWEGSYYGLGMKIYERLSGKRSFGPSTFLSADEARRQAPTLNPQGLRGAVQYYDGQFDDARLAIALARSAVDHGAVLVNHAGMVRFEKSANGILTGMVIRDEETGLELTLQARALINAAGPFCDEVMKADDPEHPSQIAPSQGIHLVLSDRFLPGDSAILIPRVEKDRVVFAIPWLGRVVIGTTDTLVPKVEEEPEALDSEIDLLLEMSARYLQPAPTRADILSIFAGIRPLVRPPSSGRTSGLSRDHLIQHSNSGLISIIGGKWTTYRKMAEDCVDFAARTAGLARRDCRTANLPLHGWVRRDSPDDPLSPYGSDTPEIEALAKSDPTLAEPLHPRLPLTGAQIVWGVKEEMARTVEDVLARRTRCLILDAEAASEAAPRTTDIVGDLLGRDTEWRKGQTMIIQRLARRSLPHSR